MKAYRKLLMTGLALAALLAMTAGVAIAGGSHGDSHPGHRGGPPASDPLTGFPDRINQVDLTGYEIVTSYPLGFDAGNTFKQTYHDAHTFTAEPLEGPFVGQPPTSARYVALPVGHRQIMLVWLFADGTHNSFVMNFETHIVSVITSGPDGAPSLGTVRITKVGDHPIP